jgi:hypothetical protein
VLRALFSRSEKPSGIGPDCSGALVGVVEVEVDVVAVVEHGGGGEGRFPPGGRPGPGEPGGPGGPPRGPCRGIKGVAAAEATRAKEIIALKEGMVFLTSRSMLGSRDTVDNACILYTSHTIESNLAEPASPWRDIIPSTQKQTKSNESIADGPSIHLEGSLLAISPSTCCRDGRGLREVFELDDICNFLEKQVPMKHLCTCGR